VPKLDTVFFLRSWLRIVYDDREAYPTFAEH
jgi:hypothetical protein